MKLCLTSDHHQCAGVGGSDITACQPSPTRGYGSFKAKAQTYSKVQRLNLQIAESLRNIHLPSYDLAIPSLPEPLVEILKLVKFSCSTH